MLGTQSLSIAAIVLVALGLCVAGNDVTPVALLFDDQVEVRLETWSSIVAQDSLTDEQVAALIAALAEFQSSDPLSFIHPTDGISLSIDVLRWFRVKETVPELMRIKGLAIFETAMCEASEDEILDFTDSFPAAKALIAIGEPVVPAIEQELLTGETKALDVQLDGLMLHWMIGPEKAIESLHELRARSSEDVSMGLALALDVVENYTDVWCFDGERLIPPGESLTLEQVLERYEVETEEAPAQENQEDN